MTICTSIFSADVSFYGLQADGLGNSEKINAKGNRLSCFNIKGVATLCPFYHISQIISKYFLVLYTVYILFFYVFYQYSILLKYVL